MKFATAGVDAPGLTDPIPYLRSMPAKHKETIDIVPSARRLIADMRDVGYDFVHAVADLIDNSIAARATRVEIELVFEGPDSWVRIADNGTAMDAAGLNEAMRPGSDRDYERDDLGKFGLGLKTASLSQCRRLSVASRVDPRRRRVEARELDLDWILENDKWKAFVLRPSDRSDLLVSPLQDRTGTVVLWQLLDRILGYRLPWGRAAENGLLALAEQLELHLAMVFHRFLAGEVPRRRTLTLKLNGKRIEPWDPFARHERVTQELPAMQIDVRTDIGQGLIGLQRYILPPKDSFSNEQSWQRAGGYGQWNALQGFYIYRSNRLIQAGGWNRMRTQDEHTKLARASVDFFPDLDSAFEINWAKVRVSLSADLREKLRQPTEELVRQAKISYNASARTVTGRRRKGGSPRSGGSPPATPPRANGGHRGPNGSGEAGHRRRGRPSTTRRAIEAAANHVGEGEALDRIINELLRADPEIARVLGW